MVSLALSAAVIAGALFALGVNRSAHAITSHAPHESRRALASLPLAAQGPVSRELGAADARYSVRLKQGGLYTSSPGDGLQAWFGRSGPTVGVGPRRLTLTLSAAGYGGALRPVAGVLPRARLNQVRYTRRGIEEWYANGPLGIEQGFTVARPLRDSDEPLTLALNLSGDLRPELVTGGRRVLFATTAGRVVASYSGLVASDASGRQLPAWLSLKHARLLLHVDQRGARYPLRIDPFIQEIAKLTASDYGPTSVSVDGLGWSVAMSSDGSTVVAGAPGATITGSAYDQGAVYVFTKPSSGWASETEATKLTASDGAKDDALGSSVAVSSDGATVVAGAPGVNSDQGAVYVFTKSSPAWSQSPRLTASDGASNDQLGYSVAISSDGARVVAGAPYASVGSNAEQGAAYVFSNSASGWAPAKKLTASGGAADDLLGLSVAMSADGSTVVAGAPSVGSAAGPGAVYVFTDSSSGWAQDKLTASDGVNNDQLGRSVAISSDGSTLVAGAPSTASGPGAAYVFTNSSLAWTQTAKLTASTGANGDQLGHSVAVSSDGSTVVAGAPGNASNQGAAYVFTKPNGPWTDGHETAQLTASDGAGGDFLGYSVAVSSDGSRRVAGAPTNSNWKQGAAYVFGLVTPAPPAVTTDAASDVHPTSATLNGAVTPNSGAITDCHFDYGATSNYGQTAQCAQHPGDGTSPVPVSAALSGLTPGTTYHYRLTAANIRGSVSGQDQTFTTLGAAPPSAAASGAPQTQWGSSTAGVSGTVNPHGSATTYSFYWGPSPVSVSSPADLQAYPHATTPASAGDGTSDVPAAGQLTGLQGATVYYYRLVATNAYGETWSSEQPLEILPPVPTNVAAPYLQANGSDASAGYDARCIPGQWQNAQTHYQIEWLWIDKYGVTRPAPGQAETFQYAGDGYKVTAQDIGQGLQCRVIPYTLDGTASPGAGARSDTLLPEAPGKAVFPKWVKQLWPIYYKLDTAYSWYDAVLDCAELADVPYLGGYICLSELAVAAFGNPIEDQMNEAIDPPDRNYRQIMLPAAVSHGRAIRCDGRTSRGRCARLRRLAAAYAQATSRTASLFEMVSASRNRTLVARAYRDSLTEQVQEAARKVYFGWLATAVSAQHGAGVAYAKALHASHIDVRTSPSLLRRAAREPIQKLIGRKLLAQLLTHGYRLSELSATFQADARHLQGFDLLRVLTAHVDPTAFTRYYDTLDLTDLTALVTGLVGQQALPAQAGSTLYADLAVARAACTQAARAGALRQFLAGADRSLAAAYRGFLSEAAAPLINGSSVVDPYPPCGG